MEFRVLISDAVAPECLAVFEEDAAADAPVVKVDYRPGLGREELLEIIPGYDGLIVRSGTQVDAEVVERAGRLRAVVRAGVGVDNVDLDAATKRGILVMNCPFGNVVAAAEHTIALICALARNIPQAHAALRAGRWERKAWVGIQLTDKVLGVVGLGKVGREVVRRARGLGMQVVGYDPFVPTEAASDLDLSIAPLDEVIRTADFLTVHVPLTAQTRGLIGAEALRSVKPGVRIINVARGGIVCEQALAEAVRDGRVAGAAVDVFEAEPPSSDHPLLGLDRVVVTPHLGASTKEAQEAVGRESAQQLIAYLRDGVMQNAINTVAAEPALLRRLAPWRELVRRLGSLQGQLREGAVRAVKVRYAGERFGPDERRLLQVSFLRGFLSHYLDQPVNEVNAALFAREQGLIVSEEMTTHAEGYVNLVTTEVETTEPQTHQIRVRRVAGTVFGESHLRLVQLDGYRTDALPSGHMVLVSNDDTPGILGTIGTMIGEAGVNIGSLSMGRDVTGGTAVAILNVDSPVLAQVQKSLAARPGIVWVKTVML